MKERLDTVAENRHEKLIIKVAATYLLYLLAVFWLQLLCHIFDL